MQSLRWFWLAGSSLCLGLTMACGSNSESEAPGTPAGGAAGAAEAGPECLCVSGTQISCACGEAIIGYQVCGTDCRTYGACVCVDGSASGASGEGGAAGSGGVGEGGASGEGGAAGSGGVGEGGASGEGGAAGSGGVGGAAGASGTGGAAGEAGVCAPGDKQCAGKTPQHCDSSGQWQDGTPCPYLCSSGECAGECAPGDKRCDGGTPEVCTGSSTWQAGDPCPFVCTNGGCAGVCEPGAKQCSGEIPQTCGDDGYWQDGTECPHLCSEGSCSGVCAPGAKQCSGNIIQTCDSQGAWQSSTSCQVACLAGACAECAPGATDCQALVPRTCDANGHWSVGQACAWVCNAGSCSCAAGTYQCGHSCLPHTTPCVVQPGPEQSKDIWTTSVYCYCQGGGGPGGGLDNDYLIIGGWGDWYHSLLQFDLEGMPKTASSATLQLYAYPYAGTSGTQVLVDRITAAWDWKTQGTGKDHLRLWWADKPPTAPFIATPLQAPTMDAWYSIDITALYNAWQSGTWPNYGVQLRPTTANNNFDTFRSSEYLADPSKRPKIVIVP